jgi:hypothetical protein
LSAWWIVHKVNPRERLHTPGDAEYHDTSTLDDDSNTPCYRKLN